MAFEIEQPGDLVQGPVVGPSKPRLLGVLGPGLITGASDDDPSGIATYSQARAQFGYALTWRRRASNCYLQIQRGSSRHGDAGSDDRRLPGNLLG